jgi:hypothetical protein
MIPPRPREQLSEERPPRAIVIRDFNNPRESLLIRNYEEESFIIEKECCHDKNYWKLVSDDLMVYQKNIFNIIKTIKDLDNKNELQEILRKSSSANYYSKIIIGDIVIDTNSKNGRLLKIRVLRR